jgi:sugar fermentation stimulation protein A
MPEGWVLINTKLHSKIAKEAIKKGVLGFVPKNIKSEVVFKHSRIDFMADNTFIELKGCSLVKDGLCLFPNAPTKRGVKHIKDLIEAKNMGYGATILIMALRRCNCFLPHPTQDEDFKKIFLTALKNGVEFKGFFIKIDDNLDVLYDGDLTLCQKRRSKDD